jgi:hypothetical protein
VWLLVFAGLWLLEEIYETGVLASILRAGARPHAEGLMVRSAACFKGSGSTPKVP